MATLSIGQASPLRAVTILGAERSLFCSKCNATASSVSVECWRPTALVNARVIPRGRQGQLKKKRDPMFGRVESQQSWHTERSCNLGVLRRTKVKAVVDVDRQDLKSFQEALEKIEVDLVTEADLKENGFRSTRRTKSGMIAQSGRTKELHKSTIQSIRQLNAEQGCCEAVMVDTERKEIHMGDLGGISSLHAEDGEEWVFTVRQFDGPVPANTIQVKYEGFAEDENPEQCFQENGMMLGVSGSLSLLGLMCYSGPAKAGEIRALNPVYGDVAVFLEVGVQLLYLGALLTLLGVGSFLVVRQVLIKRELETAAKELQDRVRSGEASSLEYFELGAVMLRKKFFSVARKHLNDAIKKWDGSEQDLAQVYNALGYSFYSDGKVELSITQYEKAVKLQPTYVTAWNNLADAYETQKNYVKALEAYEEALRFDPSNKVATAKREEMKKRVERFQGIPKS